MHLYVFIVPTRHLLDVSVFKKATLTRYVGVMPQSHQSPTIARFQNQQVGPDNITYFAIEGSDFNPKNGIGTV